MRLPSFLQRARLSGAAVLVALVGFVSAVPSVHAETVFIPDALPNGYVGQYYEQQVRLNATDGRVWSMPSGTLPPGLVRTTPSDGTSTLIKGIPTAAGTYTFTLRAAMPYSLEPGLTHTYTIIISPMDIQPSSLPDATVGVPYTKTLSVAGGTPPFEWSITSGQLPVGMNIDVRTGTITGTPLYNLTYLFTVRAKDANGVSTSRSYTIAVNPAAAPALAITSSSLPSGTAGSFYSASLGATGGTAPYSWNFASGTLPPGLSLATNGTVSGTPTTPGTYTSHIEVFDATRGFVGRDFTLTINPASVPSTGNAELTARLNNLARMGVSVHALVKLPDDGNRFTQADSAVYYVGADGRRHAFPNEKVYFTWYSNFGGVRVVSAGDLASIPLGANATYRPGVKMVKFLTDPKVYAVSSNRTPRWVKTEAAAQGLYGSSWNRQIDDISDAFYLDYIFGGEINAASDFSLTAVRASANYVSDVLPL